MAIWQCAMEGLALNPQFWKGKRVLLTGHTGFKGGWLSLWLQYMGAKVVGYALKPNTNPNLFQIADISNGITSIIGDIRDFDKLLATFSENKPEIVIHMAAQPLVICSYQNPIETYSTNVMGTVHLLEAVRKTPSVRAVVNITTDKCYENREWIWGYRENEPMGGYDPYSNSKGCAELVSSAYRTSFFNRKSNEHSVVSLATVRAGNVIGGGDWSKNRLLPDILNGFVRGEIVSIRNPQAIRPWQHVLEPLRGYLTLAELLFDSGENYAEGWNFGPNDEDVKPVVWIVNQMANLWGGEVAWQIDEVKHPHEANYLKLDISKARSRLNWHPALKLEDALKLIVEWARQYSAGKNMRNFTLKQICDYQQLHNFG
jgi:CDP-glucose 4,6-dehydratase